MAFREVQFPPRISYGAIGGPGWSTDVVTVRSGHENRNANWADMRHRWEVAQAVKTEAQFEEVRAFFLSVRGRKDGFRFKDWADHRVAPADGVVQALTDTTFQLQKAYPSADVWTLRDIRKPVASGFVLRDEGVALVAGVDYTLDTTTGVVTTATERDAETLSWSGTFDVPARFDTDELRAEIISANSSGYLLTWQSIPILEIPV
jgi:uncharacterized protein (TIGR02217 family)